MDKFKKILNIFSYILIGFLSFLIIIFLISFLKMKIFKKNYMSFFGYSYFEIVSNSMEPTFKRYDVVLVKKQDSYKVDDVITFQKENKIITHRIQEIKDNAFLTKGDNSDSFDDLVKESQLIGKVVKVYSDLGILKQVILTPKILILIVITLLLLIWYLIK